MVRDMVNQDGSPAQGVDKNSAFRFPLSAFRFPFSVFRFPFPPELATGAGDLRPAIYDLRVCLSALRSLADG
jgi:hypothetical protein